MAKTDDHTVETMTIDELARRAGTTTRNVRAHQTRGLLPPPRIAGRVGRYGADHLVRLAYIDRLQRRGFSLAAIRDLLTGWDEGRSLTEVLGFEEALTAPWSDEVPERFSREQLAEMFAEIADRPELLERAVAAGILVAEPGGNGFTAPSPRLVRVGADLVSWGVPLEAAIDESVQLAADMAPIARRMVKMFEDHVWEPFVAAGFPADRLPAVTAALQKVRPVTATAVLSVLARAMERAVGSSTAEQTARFFSPGEESLVKQ
ncbi:MAG TPA: MerR family transcriptional regulator [Acidimicrobiales bacterium]|nr:MerR family transcriptional regulator [Acidimicrobiales bacterium]